MNEIVQLINEAQKRFMSSYKEVHRIISTMPESMKELEDENEEEKNESSGSEADMKEQKNVESTQNPEKTEDGMESLDEEDDEISQEELMRILEKEVREED